jgi:APA family basic amino acid/polyamine antiporter
LAAPTLVRAVSRWQIVGLAVNDVIGSGVYLLPAAAAALLGATSVWAVLLAGLAVALLVLCFAEASSYFDDPGGSYLYTREAFGRFIGFEVGWMTWLSRVASIASLSNGFALATAYLWPRALEFWARALLIALPLALLTWINVVGVRAGARTAVVFVVAKTLPLVVFVAVGIQYVEWDRVLVYEAPRPGVLGEAALLLLFAYAGFENTPTAAGEYKNPRRDVPFALLVMVLLVACIYTAVQVVALGTLPGLAEADAPLAEAAAGFMGDFGALLMTLGAMISIQGNVGNTTLIGPRYLYAFANDGFGPRVLGRVHPRYRTPAAAIVTQSTISLVLALSGSFVQLALLSVIARLTTYIGTAAAVPILRRRFGVRTNVVRLPGGLTIPMAALVLSMVLLTNARSGSLIAGSIGLAVGAVLYQFRQPPRRQVTLSTGEDAG